MVQRSCCFFPLEICGLIISGLSALKCFIFIGLFSYIMFYSSSIAASLAKEMNQSEQDLVMSIGIFVGLAFGLYIMEIIAIAILIGGTIMSIPGLVLPWVVLNITNLLYLITLRVTLSTTPKNQLQIYKSYGVSAAIAFNISLAIIATYIIVELYRLLKYKNADEKVFRF